MLYSYFQRMLSCRKSGSAVIGVIIDPVDIHIALQQKFYQLKLFGVACHLQQIESLKVNNTQYYAWMEYFREFGQLQELTRGAAAITINRILIFEDNRIRILFNFEDAFLQAQAYLRESRTKEGA